MGSEPIIIVIMLLCCALLFCAGVLCEYCCRYLVRCAPTCRISLEARPRFAIGLVVVHAMNARLSLADARSLYISHTSYSSTVLPSSITTLWVGVRVTPTCPPGLAASQQEHSTVTATVRTTRPRRSQSYYAGVMDKNELRRLPLPGLWEPLFSHSSARIDVGV